MTKDGHAVAILSGDLTVEQRISVLDRFRAGLEKVLITTNVLARGKYAKFNILLPICRVRKIISRCAVSYNRITDDNEALLIIIIRIHRYRCRTGDDSGQFRPANGSETTSRL